MATYALVRSRKRRTLCLQINPAGAMRLLVPASTRQADIEAFLKAKAPWIERTLKRLNEAPRASVFADGLGLQHLDESLRLRLHYRPGMPEVRRDGELLQVAAPDEKQARGALEFWYREAARHHALARIIHYAPLVGRAPKRIRIAGQKTRWGSCSPRGTISLNWRLMLVPADLFDYVIAHELCHLIAPHHKAPFWRELGRVMPDYEGRRLRLREIGARLSL
ncbi:MAG: M48 family metallopeptidase [Acidiferrobacter sp.]